jgi:hypothetical protein
MSRFYASFAILGLSTLAELTGNMDWKQFIGAALGAFAATWFRNDKRRMKLIVIDAISEHEKRLHSLRMEKN